MAHTGGCLCGAIRYTITAPITELRAFKIDKGEPKRFSTKADSGRTLVRSPDMLGVRAGTLDDSSGLKITTHIWTSTARPWSHIDPRAKQVEGQAA